MAKVYPTANFTTTISGLSVSIDTSSSHSFDGSALALYSLKWGDGTIRVSYLPIIETHTYAASGRYTIALTVTDQQGRQRTRSVRVTVSAPAPVPPPPQPPPPSPATLVSLAISGPTSATTGQSLTYFATGTYSDGSLQDATPSATWSTGNNAVALVSAPGLISTVAAGSTSVGATLSGVTAPSLTLTVTAPIANPPTTPASPFPNNSAVSVSTTPTLTWSSLGATSYTVRFGSSTPPTSIFSGLTSASFSPSALANATTYYWQVTASDSGGSVTGPIWSFTTQAAAPPPSSGPQTDPLIQPTNLHYLGAFRVPQGTTGDPNGLGFSFAGGPLAYNPSGPSIFMAGYGGLVAELSLPALVNSSVLGNLNTATFLQTFHDPTEGHYGNSGTSGTIPSALGGMLVSGSSLFASGYIYYDADNTTAVSQFVRGTNLSGASFSGWQAVWTPTAGDLANGVPANAQGYVGGPLAVMPSAWQSLLGGTAIASNFGLPIITREPSGPDAMIYALASIVGSGTAAATGLLYYPQAHATLGTWDQTDHADPSFNMSTVGNGLALLPNWRTALYFGRTGTGIPGYGPGTSDPSLAGTPAPNSGGENYQYDPVDSSKGTHAYPYVYYVWAYDLNDLLAVKTGSKLPYEVVPYTTWSLSLPFPEPSCKGLYATADLTNGKLYLSQLRADPGGGFFAGPIVHVFSVS